MKVFYSDRFTVPLPDGHRFPMPKYSLLRERLEESGLISPEDLIEAGPASDTQLLRVHTTDYLEKVKNGLLSEREIRRIGLPWSPQLFERSRRSVGCTIKACRVALQEGLAANLAGGTHHAYPDHGEGYCVFNDVAVAVRAMQAESRASRIIILDCDVHQGNGTAAIFAGDHTVFTFSIHGEKNFPYYKEHSDLDIALPDGTGDEVYLEILQDGLQRCLEAAQADLAIYLAGADPYIDDRLGRLSLSKNGLAERDRMVLAACHNFELPIAIAMAGGYAKIIPDIADIHMNTLTIAEQLYQNGKQPN